MPRALLLLPSLILAAAAPAQSSFVTPPSAAQSLGGASAGFPFSYTDYVRYQQAIDPGNFPGPVLLFGMSLRVQTPQSLQSVPDPASQGIRVTLSDSANPASGLSQTFANNVAGNATVVFDGVIPIQKQNPSNPLEFNVTIPFDTVYVHGNVAPLLVELFPTSYMGATCNGGGNGTSFDGATDPSIGSVAGKGPCGTGPTVGQVISNTGFVIRFFTAPVLMPYGKACPGSNGSTPVIASSGGSSVVGNQSFAVTIGGAAPAVAAGALLIGGSNLQLGGTMLPIPAGPGMPGCFLHQDLVLALPSPVAGGSATFPFGIPPQGSLVGQSVFPQWALVDPAANRLGVISSQGGWVLLR